MACLRRGDKIGEGTFGAVYDAQLPGVNRKLVVKRNFSRDTASFVHNIREADILNQVKGHPHIVEILCCAPTTAFETPLSPRSSFSSDGTPKSTSDDKLHFVFPKSDEDLHSLATKAGVPPYAAMKKYMCHMLLGLEHIHNKGIVHFDIKPANILIDHNAVDAVGNLGVATICDFGLARPFTYQERLPINLCTAIFRPPELMMWRPNVDYKVDVWSMGCTFFELIARRHYIPVNFSDMYPKLIEDDALIAEYIRRVPGGLPLKYRRMIQTNDRRSSPQFIWPEPGDCPGSFEEMLKLSDAEKTYYEAQAGPLKLLCDLIESMMEFDPRKRFTATQCLDHPFFDQHRELITITRARYPVSNPLSRKLYSHPCVERKWGSLWLSQLYSARRSLPWYHDRVIFQSWDLYERYLHAMGMQTGAPGFAVESDLQGFIHDKPQAYLCFMVCLYIVIKYFNHHVPEWSTFIKQAQSITNIELPANSEFVAGITELGLISECLNYQVYCPTIYESADWYHKTHNSEDVVRLMMLVSRCPNLHGRTLAEIYQYYLANLTKHPYELFHLPLPWPSN